MDTTEDAWDYQEQWAKKNDEDSLCLLDLRRRVEALEQRVAAPAPAADQRRLNNPVQIAECGGPCSEGGPAACDCGALAQLAPAADRPLWRKVRGAMQAVPGEFDWVAAQLAVADWLAAREHCGAASALRAEARRARQQ